MFLHDPTDGDAGLGASRHKRRRCCKAGIQLVEYAVLDVLVWNRFDTRDSGLKDLTIYCFEPWVVSRMKSSIADVEEELKHDLSLC
jgi:hypothetical protein